MDNKMSSPTMFYKTKENKMNEYDKDWKAKSEIQSFWDKKYILTYKPRDSIYTSIMKYRYIDDYKKMKKIDDIFFQLEGIIGRIDIYCHFLKGKYDFIYQMEKITNELLILVKECNFLNIDYDDGVAFQSKFVYINNFLSQKINIDFENQMDEFKSWCDNKKMIRKVYEIFEKQIKPNLTIIYNELLRRGIKF